MMVLFEAMIWSGVLLLTASLVPVARILRIVGPGRLRRSWLGLAALIVFFIAGYCSVATLRRVPQLAPVDFLVASILFLGAGFVLAVALLSRTTTHNMMHVATLEQHAFQDALTGAANRRHFDRILSAEVERARRLGRPLSMLMIDVDHFKQVNDSHGHATGDLVLQHISAIIRDQAGLDETVARYGGEEFVMIAPGCSLAMALGSAERLVRRVAGTPAILPDGQPLYVTVSIGVASLDDDDDSVALLRNVDRSLYAAKQAGRNRCFSVPALHLMTA